MVVEALASAVFLSLLYGELLEVCPAELSFKTVSACFYGSASHTWLRIAGVRGLVRKPGVFVAAVVSVVSWAGWIDFVWNSRRWMWTLTYGPCLPLGW